MLYNADEFYPTSETLIADMLMGIDFDKIQTVLEPSAGKGDIIKRIRARDRGYGRAAPDTVANREYFLFKTEKTLQLEYAATPA